MQYSFLMHVQSNGLVLALAAALTGHAAARQPRPAGHARPAAAAPAKSTALDAAVKERVEAILKPLTDDNADFHKARRELEDLLAQVVVYAPAKDLGAATEPAYALRLVGLVRITSPERRASLMRYLRRDDAFARTLLFLMDPDDAKNICTLVQRLRVDHEGDLGDHPALAAAVCVVHARPFVDRLNENTVRGMDGIGVYESFLQRWDTLAWNGRVPAELMVYVVDTSATADELAWAASKYEGDLKVGKRYSEIIYDKVAFLSGGAKKVTEAGYSLRNILKYGGICIDQAYFAATVGKAMGVPTAIVYGKNGDLAHAWMGYLEAQGQTIAWNFDSGHYDGYKGVRGTVMDPVTHRRSAPDSILGLVAESMSSDQKARWEAVAITDGARFLGALEKKGGKPPATPDFFPGAKPARAIDTAGVLDVLEAAMRRCPTYPEGWFLLRELAEGGKLSIKDKNRWAGILDQLCGKKFPDFMVDTLIPMIESEPPEEAQAIWDPLIKSLARYPQLVSELRLAQGRQWEKAGNKNNAWAAYQDVIARYPNDGPCCVEAADRLVGLLKAGGKKGQVVSMLESLWGKLKVPSVPPSFRNQTNWYRVGQLYVRELREAGDNAKADKATRTLEQGL
jgi:hypothetical protein